MASVKKRKRLSRVTAWVRRVIGVFPFTWLGMMVIAGCSVALVHYGLEEIDLILLGVGAAGLGIAVLAVLSTGLAATLVWRAVRAGGKAEVREPDTLTLDCGYWAKTGFSVPSLWFVPFVYISWRWSSPPARVRFVRKKRRLHEEIKPLRRDTHDRLERRFEIGDIFGLCRVSFRVEQKREIQFMPSVGALRQMHVLRGLSAGEDISHPEGPAGGDRIDMRRYVPGDPIRFVLWKVFAKSRDLVVRTPERAISPSKQTVAYLVTSPHDEPAAGAARVAVDFGAFGGEWQLGADGCPDVADSRHNAMSLLARSGRATEDQSGAGLGGFLKTTSKGSVGRAVVFVPPRPGPWLDRVVAAAGSSGGPNNSQVEFVIGTDGIRRAQKASLWSKFWGPKDDEGQGPADAAEVAEVVRRLSQARLKVLVVDRAAGKIYTQDHIALKAVA